MFKRAEKMTVVDDVSGIEVTYRGRPEPDCVPLAMRDPKHISLSSQYFRFDARLKYKLGTQELVGAELSTVNAKIAFAPYTKGDPTEFTKLQAVFIEAVTQWLMNFGVVHHPIVEFGK